ncbi:MAG: hypothetical protein ACR2NP_12415 [Pirellulaceae bacterium]
MLRSILLAFLFLQGMLLGWLCLSLSRPLPEEVAEPQAVVLPTPDASTTLAVHTPQQHRQIAEQLLLGDNPGQAIPHLLNAASTQLDQADDELLFRLALCFEAAQDFLRASDLYESIARRATRDVLVTACRFGLARCHMHSGDDQAARQLLWNHYLRFDQGNQSDQETEGMFLLARSLSEGRQLTEQELMQPGALVDNMYPPLNVERQLRFTLNPETMLNPQTTSEEAAAPNPVITSAAPAGSVLIDNVMRTGEGPDELFASYHAQQCTLLFLFQWMSRKLDTPIEMTAKARQRAEQSITLVMNHVSLPAALDAQTLPFGLGWQWRGTTIVIFTADEAPEEIRQGLMDYAALRILERVLMLAPDHQHAGYLRFSLANLQHRLNNPAQALALSRDLLSIQVDPRLHQAVNFNLGQLQSLTSDGEAVSSYGRVVDSNESGPIQTVAWIKLGQIQLELGQANHATAAFARAVMAATDQRLRRDAVTGLAAAYFLDAQYQRVSETLSGHQRVLAGSPQQSVAQVLSVMSEAGGDPLNLDEDLQKKLLSGLAHWTWSSDLGKSGNYLAAEGYRFLGLNKEATEYSMQSLADAPGPWLYRRTVQQLAQLFIDQDRFDEARNVILGALAEPAWLADTELQLSLAKIEFDSGRVDDCLETCRVLLAGEGTQGQFAAALSLMGRIFEQRGDHYQAALCFAGLLPEVTQPIDTPQQQEADDAALR